MKLTPNVPVYEKSNASMEFEFLTPPPPIPNHAGTFTYNIYLNISRLEFPGWIINESQLSEFNSDLNT